MASEIASMRIAMQQDCHEQNLKRGTGGTVDVEFAIQALQLRYAAKDHSVMVPGTLAAIKVLVSRGYLDEMTGHVLATNYQFLRSVEARLRLVNTTARHDLPTEGVQLEKLAFLLNYPTATKLREAVDQSRKKIRGRYLAIFSELIKSK